MPLSTASSGNNALGGNAEYASVEMGYQKALPQDPFIIP